MINKAILIGRLGKNPELKDVASTKLAKFSLATERKYKNKEGETKKETQWHNIVVWGKQSEFVDKYIKKGDCVFVEGTIKTRSYESNGEVKYITEIIADNVRSISVKSNEDNTGHRDNVNEVIDNKDDSNNNDDEGDLPF